eukprot:Pompholyxophrys_punicea_v1_NODE_837_length_1228_cov_11.849105.p2 type:complete len:154 gc:universal NODE_837_length_1228_cov_11.849105:723-262(-)
MEGNFSADVERTSCADMQVQVNKRASKMEKNILAKVRGADKTKTIFERLHNTFKPTFVRMSKDCNLFCCKQFCPGVQGNREDNTVLHLSLGMGINHVSGSETHQVFNFIQDILNDASALNSSVVPLGTTFLNHKARKLRLHNLGFKRCDCSFR